ncbi:uncharacterized protein [Diadema setosum]|uniref:uncharacterized protein n=1 Tax=Diadema setosum TaxID=31175 RepID=UPI003B3A0553
MSELSSSPSLTLGVEGKSPGPVSSHLATSPSNRPSHSRSAQLDSSSYAGGNRAAHKVAYCSRCELWFEGVLDFIRHHAQHDIDEAAPCILCSQSFSTKVLLIGHYVGFHKLALFPVGEDENNAKDQLPHVDHSYHRPEDVHVDGAGEGEVDAEGEVEGGVSSAEILPEQVTKGLESLTQADNQTESVEDNENAWSPAAEGSPKGHSLCEEQELNKSSCNTNTTEPSDNGDGMDKTAQCAGETREPFTESQASQTFPDLSGDGAAERTDSVSMDAGFEILKQEDGNLGDDKHENDATDRYSDGFLEQSTDDEHDDDDMQVEFEKDDFRFISGLRHKQIHIAHSNLVTDIGLHVFICLHCDFVDNETGLVNHMKSTHMDILEGERQVTDYDRMVPSCKILPDDVTGEEVLRLSEYHQRNLDQKREAACKRKKPEQRKYEGKKLEIKKRYVEDRTPCLCPKCGKILCRKSSLRTHILGVHGRSRNHLCEVCGKAFRAAHQLSQHRKTHRSKLFSCELCDFTSDMRTAIFEHQQLHPSKFGLCHVCGTVLKTKTALKRHMKVHSESRPFACTFKGCTWRFNSEALLKGHFQAHSSLGKFICLECQRRFRKRHHVRRHLKNIHGKASNAEADKSVAVDTKVVVPQVQLDQIPVTQLSKRHILITTDKSGTPIFCDPSEEIVFDSKSSSKLNLIEQNPD